LVPFEKPIPVDTTLVNVLGANKAWYDGPILYAIVDGWTLAVPYFFGAEDRATPTRNIAAAIIAWSQG